MRRRTRGAPSLDAGSAVLIEDGWGVVHAVKSVHLSPKGHQHLAICAQRTCPLEHSHQTPARGGAASALSAQRRISQRSRRVTDM
jgi:hypothetical protein